MTSYSRRTDDCLHYWAVLDEGTGGKGGTPAPHLQRLNSFSDAETQRAGHTGLLNHQPASTASGSFGE